MILDLYLLEEGEQEQRGYHIELEVISQVPTPTHTLKEEKEYLIILTIRLIKHI